MLPGEVPVSVVVVTACAAAPLPASLRRSESRVLPGDPNPTFSLSARPELLWWGGAGGRKGEEGPECGEKVAVLTLGLGAGPGLGCPGAGLYNGPRPSGEEEGGAWLASPAQWSSGPPPGPAPYSPAGPSPNAGWRAGRSRSGSG